MIKEILKLRSGGFFVKRWGLFILCAFFYTAVTPISVSADEGRLSWWKDACGEFFSAKVPLSIFAIFSFTTFILYYYGIQHHKKNLMKKHQSESALKDFFFSDVTEKYKKLECKNKKLECKNKKLLQILKKDSEEENKPFENNEKEKKEERKVLSEEFEEEI